MAVAKVKHREEKNNRHLFLWQFSLWINYKQISKRISLFGLRCVQDTSSGQFIIPTLDYKMYTWWIWTDFACRPAPDQIALLARSNGLPRWWFLICRKWRIPYSYEMAPRCDPSVLHLSITMKRNQNIKVYNHHQLCVFLGCHCCSTFVGPLAARNKTDVDFSIVPSFFFYEHIFFFYFLPIQFSFVLFPEERTTQSIVFSLTHTHRISFSNFIFFFRRIFDDFYTGHHAVIMIPFQQPSRIKTSPRLLDDFKIKNKSLRSVYFF